MSIAGPSTQGPLDVDSIIQQLLEVRGSRPGRQVNLTEADIRGLCTHARDIFMSQPVLLELEAPIKICGARTSRPRRASGRLSASWSPPPPVARPSLAVPPEYGQCEHAS